MSTRLKEAHRKKAGQKDYQRLFEESKKGLHGYLAFLGLRAEVTHALLREINRGIDYAAFEQLRAYLELSAQELGEAVLLSPRTLTRRKKEGRLTPEESDRLVRVSRIFALALDLFEGDYDAARNWLGRKQVGLGGAIPLDLMRSDVGAREVEALIGRLEHGVYV
jgi:putative toxin-antitoxin system antitoxin component (TIGR02293 family)